MKKTFIAAMLLTAFALGANAKNGDKFTNGQFTFTVLSEDAKTVRLSGYTEGESTVADIPSIAKNGDIEYSVVTLMTSIRNTTKLEKIILPESVTSVQIAGITRNEALKEIVFPENSIKFIGSSAINNNNSIETLILPNSIDSIGSYGLFANAGVTTLKLPESLRVMESSALSGSQSLESVTIPESVRRLGARVFMNCFKLKTLHIPAGVTTIGNSLAVSCDLLEEITIDPKNEYFIVENGVLYNKDKTRLITVPSGNSRLTEFVVPSTVTTLNEDIFARNPYLTSITVPETVTEIEGSVFMHCINLKEMKLPSKIKDIKEYLFYNCKSLEKVWIPDVASFADNSFSNTIALKEVYYNCTAPVETDNIFTNATYTGGTLYVPENAVEKAKNTTPWSKFANIEAYDFNSGVDNVGAEDAEGPVEVYNLSGVKVGEKVNGLPAGIYIVHGNGRTFKIIVDK